MSVPSIDNAVHTQPMETRSMGELQDRRQDLVEQYTDAHSTGSAGWSLGAGIGGGVVAAGDMFGAALLASRGHGASYQ